MNEPSSQFQSSKLWDPRILGPGILVAATGVGAGDLATATFTGATLGSAILWAVLVGAGLKYVLNEGLTRWQLVTGSTLLEGASRHLGRPLQLFFLVYLVIWSYLVAMALMSACGVAAHAMLPIFQDPAQGKLVFGFLQSLVAVLLVYFGGYAVFEQVMRICIGVMFVVVCATAALLLPDWSTVLTGLLIPTIPKLNEPIGQNGLEWTIALLGGVGGTVTVLCYGYWIREENRTGPEDLRLCRLDLAVGYIMTAIFGLAMVLIGSSLGKLEASGATLIMKVADTLQAEMGGLGGVAKWSFLLGAWGAFFSSLLGVWQSVPYIFTDFWRLFTNHRSKVESIAVDTRSWLYRLHLILIATLPVSGVLLLDFKFAMKINGLVGALFIPMLALALLYLNGSEKRVGKYKNSLATTVVLCIALLIFVVAGGFKVIKSLGSPPAKITPTSIDPA